MSVRSPDGKNTIILELLQAGNGLTFSIKRSGLTLFRPSPIKLALEGKGRLDEGVRLRHLKENHLDESFTLPWGKCGQVTNVCSEAQLRLENGAGVLWDLELRAYDDGVAFRYGIPEQKALDDFVLEDESTEFHLTGDPTVLFTTAANFTTSHEYTYQRKSYSELPENTLIDLPLLAVWPDGPSAALTEAGLRNFAGMYLERPAGAEVPVLRAVLSPHPSRPGALVVGRAPHWSPWRVVLLADEAGRHLESNILLRLNDPPEGDFSWLQPGKTTWHWWNGTAEEDLLFPSGMNFETHRYYIDFCARNGIAYHAVVADDRPWYQQSLVDYSPGPDTDILVSRPELELPRIFEYARQKGVGIRLWVHWKPLDERLEEALTRYEEWGVRGLMVDFLDRDDQEMVEYYERALKAAASHKIHIQFHGSYKPSGEQRTFPNLFNREGVLNLEYLKWTARCTPQHNVDVAYTRALAGPTDYHLGGFRSVSPAQFVPRSTNPQVLGSRCHHLALYIVYENPMPMVSDSPSSYEGQTGFEFLKEVPTTWDETRFLDGQAGEFVVLARRKDRVWYLGGITNGTARDLSVPLDVLGSGEFEAEVFVDGSLSEDEPNAIRKESRTIEGGSKLAVKLAPGGGFVAKIHPKSTTAP
ncbi:MAG: glycoside hydrolase family 97 protein [Candidatus Aminicenantales bacterium]